MAAICSKIKDEINTRGRMTSMVVFFREWMKRLKIIVLPDVTIYIIKPPYKKGRRTATLKINE
tara:strand:- start:542 stop:730 length:189 start_codon:yes stop_codon:yes gene_type:complete